MHIQVNFSNNINGSEEFSQKVKSLLNSKLNRFSDKISRVEVHFNDGHRCMLEVRIEGKQPLAVTHQASTIDLALTGATEKLKNTLETRFGRIQDRHQRGAMD